MVANELEETGEGEREQEKQLPSEPKDKVTHVKNNERATGHGPRKNNNKT